MEKFKLGTADQRLMSPARMLSHNLTIVLQTLIEKGPMSQSDISRALECSKSTISNSTALLEKKGLVIKAGSGNPKTGRKSVLLKFNPEVSFFIAIDLRWKKIDLAIVDMVGEIHHSTSQKYTGTDPNTLIETIKTCMISLTKNSGLPDSKIEGVGITVPGIVDTDRGVVRYSSILRWDKEVPLVALLRDIIDKQVTISNNANALALCEMWIGKGKGYSHLAFIYTAGGLGGACIYDGEPVIGHNFAAGEFGKMLVSSGEIPRRAEDFMSLSLLLTRFGNIKPESMDYDEIVKRMPELLSVRADPASDQKMIDELVNKMAQMIVNIIVVFDPQIIIVHCSFLPDPEFFISTVKTKVIQYLPKNPCRSTNIVLSTFNDKTEVLGAAAAAIKRSRFSFVIQRGNSKYA